MAEALNSLFRSSCIRNPVMRSKGGWKSVADVEIAVVDYVEPFNHRWLHGEIELVPPAEFETNHGPPQSPPTTLKHPSRPGRVPSDRASTKSGAIQ